MKKLWVGMVVCGGLLTGISLTYARIIPGVDEPYNPGAYYSSTAISSADSPSTFFYRDLAGGGNIVYDPERHKNNILSCLKYEEVLKTVQELFKKKKEDATPFGNEGIRAGLQNVQQETISLNLAEEINNGADKVFSNDKMTADEYNQLSRTEQIKYMNDVYKKVVENNQKSLQNSSERQELLEQAMQRSASAQGSMQAEQAKVDIQALMQEELAERNMLLDNFASMHAMAKRYEMEKEMKQARDAMEVSSQFGFSDPYNMDAYEKRHYEKPQPMGLPDF